jgi:hypothetical protein
LAPKVSQLQNGSHLADGVRKWPGSNLLFIKKKRDYKAAKALTTPPSNPFTNMGSVHFILVTSLFRIFVTLFT